MSSEAHPVIVFAPGAWHLPSCFDIVRADLESRGWETEGVTYPSVGAEPPNKGLADDAAAVRAVLEKLVDLGKQIVLVAHSYGGLTGAEALEGLAYAQRKRDGKAGGVIMFVYLAAFANPKGMSLLDMLQGQWLPWMMGPKDFGPEGSYITVDNPEAIMYHDVDPTLRTKVLAELRHQSGQVFIDKVAYEPWHHVPCMYIFCEDDKALPIEYQRAFAQQFGQDAPSYLCKTSHSPFLSQPQEVVEALFQAAQIGQAKIAA
ncbi:Alpha/beta hydrolase fold-1 [Xylariales sp. PMI_506]|nr:Alpha/beta hydrolase fold-1 [Xylariales sp. PMI_506]